MRKISPILTFFLMVTIPVMVILLSSNISLRFSGTYGFFFNDQRTVAATGYDVESDEPTQTGRGIAVRIIENL